MSIRQRSGSPRRRKATLTMQGLKATLEVMWGWSPGVPSWCPRCRRDQHSGTGAEGGYIREGVCPVYAGEQESQCFLAGTWKCWESVDTDSGKFSVETRKDHVSSCKHSLMPELNRQDLALSRGLLGTRQDQSCCNQWEKSPGGPVDDGKGTK